jgi:uncharacterized membrane protein YqjE
MPAGDRSFAEILQDVIGNVQEIVRSEVRLAKAEMKEEAAKAKSSAMLLGVGAASAAYAVLFLLLMTVYALTLVMPNWAAALVVGGALAIVAAVAITAGMKRFKEIHPTPERTLETIKENVEWVKQQSK